MSWVFPSRIIISLAWCWMQTQFTVYISVFPKYNLSFWFSVRPVFSRTVQCACILNCRPKSSSPHFWLCGICFCCAWHCCATNSSNCAPLDASRLIALNCSRTHTHNSWTEIPIRLDSSFSVSFVSVSQCRCFGKCEKMSCCCRVTSSCRLLSWYFFFPSLVWGNISFMILSLNFLIPHSFTQFRREVQFFNLS